MENAVSVGTFGEKKCASTMQFVPRHTEIRHRRNIENLSACYSTAGLMNRTKSARCAARRARRWTGSISIHALREEGDNYIEYVLLKHLEEVEREQGEINLDDPKGD